MSKSATSFFSFGRKTFVTFGAVLGFAATGLVADSSAQTPTPTPTPTARVIRATSTNVQQSTQAQTATINLQIDSLGNESSASFSLNFNPAVLSNPVITLGNGVPANSNLATNLNNAAQGQVGVLVDSTNTFAAGTRNIANVTFTVAANAAPGSYPVSFGNAPAPQSVSSALGALLPTTYQSGNIQVGTVTAAGVQVTGRVVTPDGRGIRNARVIMTDAEGNRRVATTSSFGIYTFEEIEAGQTYIFSVQSKQYRFSPRQIQVVDSLTDFDFIGQQ